MCNRWKQCTNNDMSWEEENDDNNDSTNNQQYVLIQIRAKIKDYCPCKLDPTPGGAVEYNDWKS